MIHHTKMTISQKIGFFVLIVVLTTFCSCAPCLKGEFKVSSNAALDDKPYVAVMPFSVAGNLDQDIGEKFAHSIGTELVPYYQMVERGEISKLLEELGLSAGGVIDDRSLPKLGEILGVKTAILGKIYKCEIRSKAGIEKYYVSANLRMVEIESSAIIWSLDCELTHSAKSVHDIGNIFARKFAEKLSDELMSGN